MFTVVYWLSDTYTERNKKYELNLTLKQVYNPNWRESDLQAIYVHYRGVELVYRESTSAA